jgi:hypothetical protein
MQMTCVDPVSRPSLRHAAGLAAAVVLFTAIGAAAHSPLRESGPGKAAEQQLRVGRGAALINCAAWPTATRLRGGTPELDDLPDVLPDLSRMKEAADAATGLSVTMLAEERLGNGTVKPGHGPFLVWRYCQLGE